MPGAVTAALQVQNQTEYYFCMLVHVLCMSISTACCKCIQQCPCSSLIVRKLAPLLFHTGAAHGGTCSMGVPALSGILFMFSAEGSQPSHRKGHGMSVACILCCKGLPASGPHALTRSTRLHRQVTFCCTLISTSSNDTLCRNHTRLDVISPRSGYMLCRNHTRLDRVPCNRCAAATKAPLARQAHRSRG